MVSLLTVKNDSKFIDAIAIANSNRMLNILTHDFSEMSFITC